MDTKLVFIIIALALMIFILFSLIKVRLSMPKDGEEVEITKENYKENLDELKMLKAIEDFDKNNNLDHLFKISRNPWNFNKLTWNLVRYVVPLVCVIACVFIYVISSDLFFSVIPMIGAFAAFFVPTSHYKGLVKNRERAWNKIVSHLWRVSNSLETNDPKKVCVEMKDYFTKVGEVELASGFEAFYECWPETFDGTNEAMQKFEEYFPFEIPKNLYYILLECWRNSAPANERLNNFAKTCEMKYNQYSNELLAAVPSKATMYSLPFLLISVMAAVLFPAALTILEAMSG